jgi:hypothetical protein
LGAPNWANSYAPETTGRLLEAAGFVVDTKEIAAPVATGEET